MKKAKSLKTHFIGIFVSGVVITFPIFLIVKFFYWIAIIGGLHIFDCILPIFENFTDYNLNAPRENTFLIFLKGFTCFAFGIILICLVGFIPYFVSKTRLGIKIREFYTNSKTEFILKINPTISKKAEEATDEELRLRDISKYLPKYLLREPVVISNQDGSLEIGFLTSKSHKMNGLKRSSVFIPGGPIPMSGKLLFIENNKIEK